MSEKRPLDHIYLTGYKSIANLDLKLNSLNILIGPNGAGKTNFISLFTLLRRLINKDLAIHIAQQGGAERFLHFGRKVTEVIELKLRFGTNVYKSKLTPAARDTLVLSEEQVAFQRQMFGTGLYGELLGGGHKETNLFNKDGKPASAVSRHVINSLKNWQVYHFHDTSPSAKVKQTSDLNDNATLRGDAGNLAPFLYRLQETEPKAYHKIGGRPA